MKSSVEFYIAARRNLYWPMSALHLIKVDLVVFFRCLLLAVWFLSLPCVASGSPSLLFHCRYLLLLCLAACSAFSCLLFLQLMIPSANPCTVLLDEKTSY